MDIHINIDPVTVHLPLEVMDQWVRQQTPKQQVYATVFQVLFNNGMDVREPEKIRFSRQEDGALFVGPRRK